MFPKDVLVTAGVLQGEIHNGLNGVVLEKQTNRRFWKYSPHEYVKNVTEKKGIGEVELQGRIGGHLVPFEEMVSMKGAVGNRYRRFLAERTELLSARIEELANLRD